MLPRFLISFLQRLRPKQTLAPEHAALRTKWLEVVFIPLIVMGMSWYWRPDDPFLLKAAFPWLWFAPVMVALRYGVMPGLTSGFLILGSWLLASALGATVVVQAEFPRDYFFGGGLLILLCGEFSDVWRDRVLRMDETNLYVTERLSRLTKRHLLLNLSHDRLEQEMLARPGSLRDALISLRDQVLSADRQASKLPGLPALLHLLAQYVNIEAAAIYLVDDQNGDVTLGAMAESLGDPHVMDSHDALFKLAVETRSLAHVASSEVSYERHSSQLIVVPLIASNDHIIGVLAVAKLPFFSLSVENLQMMSVTLAYYADHVLNAEDVAQCRTLLPTMPATFAEELARMVRLQRKVGITSHLVVMTFSGDRKAEIPVQFLQIKRGLDLYWLTYVTGDPVVVILLPFASTSAKEGFFLRVQDWLQQVFGGNFDSLRIHFRSIDLSQEDPFLTLTKIMQP